MSEYGDIVEVDGICRSLREWIDILSSNYKTQHGRALKLVPSFGIGRPAAGKYEVNGVVHSVQEWARLIGIDGKSFRCRYARFLRGEITADQVLAPRNESHVRNTSAPIQRDVIVEFDGRTVALRELSRECGIHVNTLFYRIYKVGMPISDAISKPVRAQRVNTPEDKKKIKEAASRLGLSTASIYNRIKRGMSVDEATTIEKSDKTVSIETARDAKGRKAHLRELSAMGVVV